MPDRLEEIIEELRGRGQRITVPRRWVLKVLYDEKSHLTVEKVGQRLRENDVEVDEATIYRTLQWLKQNRIVAQTTLGSGADVYSLISVHQHHHLICVDCGAISELDDGLFVLLREKIHEDYDFVPFIDHYAIFGLCAECSAARETRQAEAK